MNSCSLNNTISSWLVPTAVGAVGAPWRYHGGVTSHEHRGGPKRSIGHTEWRDMATTQANNKKLVEQFVEAVFNEGNLDRMDTYLAAGYVEHTPGPNPDVEGIAAAKEYHGRFNEAFPDFEVTIEDLLAEGNTVVQRSRISGTHEGEFMDIPPTGKSADIQGIVLYEIEDGKIVESWALADMMGVMQQLGVVEGP